MLRQGGRTKAGILSHGSIPPVQILSDDHTDSTEESEGEYDSHYYSHVDMCMDDIVDDP